MEMDDDLFLSEQHAVSRRHAIMEDDGGVACLYLTARESTRPIARCWLYNRIAAPAERNFARGETPVVPMTHAASGHPFQPPPASSVRLRWSPEGHAVAVFFGPDLMGFIAWPDGPGFSRFLKTAGPYGTPLDSALYSSVFAVAPGMGCPEDHA
jgi:hypothetical protein